MKLDKNIACKVHIHRKSLYLTSFYKSFSSIDEIKGEVKRVCNNKGIVQVSIYQDGGYEKSFNINTSK